MAHVQRLRPEAPQPHDPRHKWDGARAGHSLLSATSTSQTLADTLCFRNWWVLWSHQRRKSRIVSFFTIPTFMLGTIQATCSRETRTASSTEIKSVDFSFLCVLTWTQTLRIIAIWNSHTGGPHLRSLHWQPGGSGKVEASGRPTAKKAITLIKFF